MPVSNLNKGLFFRHVQPPVVSCVSLNMGLDFQENLIYFDAQVFAEHLVVLTLETLAPKFQV